MRRARPAPPLPLALGLLGALAAVAVVVVALLVGHGPLGGVLAAYAYLGLAALYLAAGLLAWWRRPVNRLGPLLTFGGATWLLGGLQNTGEVPAVIAIGLVASSLPLSVAVHLLHACPSGRLRDGWARATVAAAYVVGVVLQVPLWAFTPQPPPFDVLVVDPDPDLARLGTAVQQWCGLAVTVATLVLTVRRLREYDPAQRRVLAPLFVLTVIAVLAIPVGGDVLLPIVGPERTVEVQFVALALVPVGFVVVVLRGGFGRVRGLDALVGSIVSSGGSRRELGDAVARALGDPASAVLRWSEPRQAYVDDRDEPVAPPSGPLRSLVRIDVGHRHLGVLAYDAELTVDPAVPEALAGVVAIALDRERLAEEATEGRRALQAASARVLEESDRVRRQIAQDLHDGLQVSLVLLSMQAHAIAADHDGAADAAGALARDVDRAAASLRALVAGVMPPPLVERGLAAAVADLAAQLPIRAQLEVDGVEARLAPPVESTAYFVVAEGLTNVVKHAGATTVDVSLRQVDDQLHISVVDDGGGGAAVRTGGLGLHGLHDRLQVLGGSITVASGPEGTRLEARLPCA